MRTPFSWPAGRAPAASQQLGFGELPEELLVNMLSRLPPGHFCFVKPVCKNWRRGCDAPWLWAEVARNVRNAPQQQTSHLKALSEARAQEHEDQQIYPWVAAGITALGAAWVVQKVCAWGNFELPLAARAGLAAGLLLATTPLLTGSIYHSARRQSHHAALRHLNACNTALLAHMARLQMQLSDASSRCQLARLAQEYPEVATHLGIPNGETK